MIDRRVSFEPLFDSGKLDCLAEKHLDNEVDAEDGENFVMYNSVGTIGEHHHIDAAGQRKKDKDTPKTEIVDPGRKRVLRRQKELEGK